MWPNPHETADFVTFTKEILNGKPHLLCSNFTVADTQEIMYLKKINPLSTNVSLLYPLRTSEHLGFLMFSGGIGLELWLKMG